MSADGAWYVDSSALVKLAVAEAETVALRADLLTKTTLVGSELLFVEVPRAVQRHGPEPVFLGRSLVESLSVLVEVDREVLDRAAGLPPPVLRSLDAIHLATALGLGSGLAGMITYDDRLAEAAVGLGMEVVSPGR